jgi:hypothetical protein
MHRSIFGKNTNAKRKRQRVRERERTRENEKVTERERMKMQHITNNGLTLHTETLFKYHSTAFYNPMHKLLF